MSFWYVRHRRGASADCTPVDPVAYPIIATHPRRHQASIGGVVVWDRLGVCGDCCCEFLRDTFETLNPDIWEVTAGVWTPTPIGFGANSVLRTDSTAAGLACRRPAPSGPYVGRVVVRGEGPRSARVLWNYVDADNHYYQEVGSAGARFVRRRGGRDVWIAGLPLETPIGPDGGLAWQRTISWTAQQGSIGTSVLNETNGALYDGRTYFGFALASNAVRIAVSGTGDGRIDLDEFTLSRVEIGCGNFSNSRCLRGGAPVSLDVTIPAPTDYPYPPGTVWGVTTTPGWPCQGCAPTGGTYHLRECRPCVPGVGLWQRTNGYTLNGLAEQTEAQILPTGCPDRGFRLSGEVREGVASVTLLHLSVSSGTHLELAEWRAADAAADCRQFSADLALAGVARYTEPRLCNYPQTIHVEAHDS